MKVALFAATLGLGLMATPARALVIRAEIILGQPRYHERVVHVYPRPVRRVVVHRHHQPRVIVVERHHRGRGYLRNHRKDYRVVRAWYDHRRSEYYDGYRPGLREVTLYHVNGRYYDDDFDDRRDRYHRDR